MGKRIDQYAAHVAKPDVWLDWLDAVLFAENHEKALGIINYHRKDGLKIEHANQWLNAIPGVPERECSDVMVMANTWILCSCNAAFDIFKPCNHWIPCVHRESVSDQIYADLVHRSIAKYKILITELESSVLDLEIEEGDDEANQAMKVQLQMQIESQLANTYLHPFRII